MSFSSQRSLFTPFLDNAGKRALSVTYPVSADLQNQLRESRGPGLGQIEAKLNYPCFQIYSAVHTSFLSDVAEQQQAKRKLLYIIAELHKNNFFAVFEGVRFELYDSRPEFRQHLNSGKANPQFARALRDHATAEREHRNTLQIFRGTVNAYNIELDRSRKRRLADMDAAGLVQEKKELTKVFEDVCNVGGLISDNIASFNFWRARGHQFQTQRNELRRKTGSDLDLSRNLSNLGFRRPHSCHAAPLPPIDVTQQRYRRRTKSVGDLTQSKMLVIAGRQDRSIGISRLTLKPPFRAIKEVPTLDYYMKARIQRLVRQLLARFYAPLTPTSFFCPPYHRWHAMVLILHSTDITHDGLYVMEFEKELSVDEMDDFELFNPDRLDRAVSHVSVNSDHMITSSRMDNMKRATHLSAVLGHRLYSLGLHNPLFRPRYMRAAATADPSAWFSNFLDGQKDDLPRDLPMFDVNGDMHWDQTSEDDDIDLATPPEFENELVQTHMNNERYDTMMTTNKNTPGELLFQDEDIDMIL